MNAQDFRSLQEAYMNVYQELDEALTGERLQRAKEIIEKDPKSPKAKDVKRVAGSQEGSDRGDTLPGDLPRDRRNTTLPTGRGGRGRKGRGKTTNRPGGGGGYPLGGRVGQSDQGRGNRATRRSGGDVEDTRYDEETDLYDTILSHLLDEGYAETPEAAEAIMVNMSEDWREDIMEVSDRKVKAVRNAREKQWNNQFGKNRVQDPTDDMVNKVDKLIDQRNKRTGSSVKKTAMGQLSDKFAKQRRGEV